MKRAFLVTMALILAACSEEPVGNSAYFDPWENPALRPAPVEQPSAEVRAINQAIEAKRLENQRQISPRPADRDFVSSLETAIATAGNDAASNQRQVITVVPDNRLAQTQGDLNPSGATAPIGINGSEQISDNSFSNVVQNQTIETDRERLARLEQSKVELEAAPLPDRDPAINLAAFARSTNHNIGTRIYKRSFRGSASRECRKYGNPDAAQRAFLAAGGPANDPLKLDPDGDGFVCGWSPIPFRNLRVNG